MLVQMAVYVALRAGSAQQEEEEEEGARGISRGEGLLLRVLPAAPA